MSGLFFSLAFFVAIAALGWRAWTRRQAQAALDTRLSALGDATIDVAGFEGIDAAVERARCPACGARCTRVGEGPGRDPQIYSVTLRCPKCGATPTLQFRLPTAIN